ncbi:MAG: TraB/GumN family protein [Minisyncoccales bacterium]
MVFTTSHPIKILGTNHIAHQSVKQINEEFDSYTPDIVAVELDKQRFASLFSDPSLQKKASLFSLVRQFGTVGGLFLFIGQKMQKKLGKIVDMVPGDDMRAAVRLTQKEKKELALIDIPIHKTIKNLSQQLTFKEKMRFIGEFLLLPFIFLGVGFISLFPKLKKRMMNKKNKHSLSLSSVPSQDTITVLLTQLKKKYPTFYKVLLDDRNRYMAKQLIILHKKNPDKKILAVVGAGHKKEIESYISQLIHSFESI